MITMCQSANDTIPYVSSVSSSRMRAEKKIMTTKAEAELEEAAAAGSPDTGEAWTWNSKPAVEGGLVFATVLLLDRLNHVGGRGSYLELLYLSVALIALAGL